MCEIKEKGPHKTHWLSGFLIFSKSVCNPWELCGPRFPRVVICIKYCKEDLIKPVTSVVSCKFQKLLVIINTKCVFPVFKGGKLCEIMLKKPHKTPLGQWFSAKIEICL